MTFFEFWALFNALPFLGTLPTGQPIVATAAGPAVLVGEPPPPMLRLA
jgi:hypothetical protein